MVNKVFLIGRLGADPEVRYTPDGTMVTSFRLATDEQWKDKSGQKVQRTEWHRIVTFGKLAEICGNFLSKGKLIFVDGRIRTQSWEDKEGNKRYTTEIVAATVLVPRSIFETVASAKFATYANVPAGSTAIP